MAVVKRSQAPASAFERAVDHYLSRYAEAETAHLPAHVGPLRFALVIPAYDESPDLLQRLDGCFAATSALLVILVVNRPTGSRADSALPDALQRRYAIAGQQHNLHWFSAGNGGSLLLVDRFSDGLTLGPRQGVGLARKIGCDLACQLMHRGQIESPWLFSSDADVCWPAGYFAAAAQIAATPDLAALNYRFAHQPQADLDPLPTQLYEFSLHYYVLGLAWAGSPWVHHSLGSTLAIDYRHYARVRGFPKRAAGEDFYLLNKLAKSGHIQPLTQPLLRIIDRRSGRTPFGTGAAQQRISQLRSPLREYPLYHPQCFSYLRRWHRWLAEQRRAPADSPTLWRDQQAVANADTAAWMEPLAAMGVVAALEHATRQSRDGEGFGRHMWQWFDAFRTLKFVHALRDSQCPSLNLIDLLATPWAGAVLPPLPVRPSGQNRAAPWLQTCNALLAERLYR